MAKYNKKNLPVDELIEMYNMGIGSVKIARAYNVSKHTILRCLHDAGVDINKKRYIKLNTCVICGEKFRKNPDRLHPKNRLTCGDECLKILKERNRKFAEQHWNWAGGTSPRYYQKVAYERYGFERECAFCKTKEKVAIHHIDGDKKNNYKKNLIAVCNHCHMMIHAVVKQYEKSKHGAAVAS